MPRADALHPQVVRVLAEVRELDHRRPGLDAARARARTRTPARPPARARARAGSRSTRRAQAEQPRHERAQLHLTSSARVKLRRARDDPRRVEAEPLLEQRRVDGAEVGGRLQVAVRVEARREPGNSPTCVPAARVPIRNAGARGAVVGPARAVLLRAPAELRPDERQHAVGDAARLEVALEREERRGGRRQRGRRARRPAPACVSYSPVASSATQRSGSPAAIIAARPCRLLRERVVAGRVRRRPA